MRGEEFILQFKRALQTKKVLSDKLKETKKEIKILQQQLLNGEILR